jgi:prepilin-type N-terminal cleavage/methylation domain-containing protein
MQRLNVTKYRDDQGFTLLEVLTVVIIIGIISAIASPGMLGFLARSKVTAAQGELQGLLQEAQRSAIRDSDSCSLTLPATGSKSADQADSVLSVSASCVGTGTQELEEVILRHNFADVSPTYDGTATLTAELFNYQGSTDESLVIPAGQASGNLIIVISTESDSTIFQKCIVVSDGLGLIRAGNYSGDTAGALDSSLCAPSN